MKINKKRRKKQNNAGSAIVLVIVVMAIMGILVSTILYMALANYQMKANDLQTKDNFYTAESILDEIRVGLQKKASTATDIAYMKVIQNYDTYADDATARRSEFVYQYVNTLREDLKLGNDDRTYDIEKLKNFVTGVELVTNLPAEATKVGAEITAVDGKNEMVAYTEALVLKNIRVKYKDKKGFVSIITTDIRIGIPDMSFETGLQVPEIINYSLIANDQIIAKKDNTNISGCVYAGKDGILAEDSKELHFTEAEVIATPSKIEASKNGTIIMDGNTNLWAQDTVVNQGTLKLLGNSYIEDDTTVEGRGSTLEISGKYMGFGMDNGGDTVQAEDSSAIVINGIKSKVDLSGLSRLLLPGNAYISFDSINNDVYNNKDKRLGESLTAKASQIAYLVPSECIGWIKEKDSDKYQCVLGTNPVLYSKYIADFNPSNTDLSGNNKNQSPLPEKIEVDFSQADENYAAKYGAKYDRVFVPTSDGDTLIYYYMTFNTQESASKFFKEYFEDNKDKIAQYLDIYVDTLKVGSDNEDTLDINVAGNILRQVEKEKTKADGTTEIVKEYELISETKSADTAMGIDYSTEITTYTNVFKGLTTKLIKDASKLTADEIKEVDRTAPNNGRGLFYNIIDTDQLDNIVGVNRTVDFRDINRDVKAIITTVSNYAVDHETDPETSLIVAKGDVHVTRPFTGTIISGGTIYIECSGGGTVDIGYDEEMVRKVLDIEDTITTPTGASEKVTVMTFFKDGANMLQSSSSLDKDKKDKISIEDLVTYDNWSKE